MNLKYNKACSAPTSPFFIGFNQQRFKAALEHMARAMVAAVEAHRVGYLKLAHEFAQIRSCSLNQQVEMIGHQNIGDQIDIKNFAAVGQRFQKAVAILFDQKNILPVITPVHHVVITVCHLDS